MSKKSPRIAALIASCQGQALPAHYLGYFECFNRELFYEAHDVLEELWLPQRGQVNDLFYKGLIQLAGAFVHLQKNRLGPAQALFKLAQKNLSLFGPCHEQLNLLEVLELIAHWQKALQTEPAQNPLPRFGAPKLHPTPVIRETP